MTEQQHLAGSLRAVITRVCQQHGPECLEHRQIEDLGEIARFEKEEPWRHLSPALAKPSSAVA